MADVYDRAQVEAFLDDLTRLCLKHGFFIDTSQAEDRYDLPELDEIKGRSFAGYKVCSSSGLNFLASCPSRLSTYDVAEGKDISGMSAHEKMAFIAEGRS